MRFPPRSASLLLFVLCAGFTFRAAGADTAPPWMHALSGVPVPAHDDKTVAVILEADTVLTVAPNGQIKRLERHAYKILRPEGARYGTVLANFDPLTRITALHAWSIPSIGSDYAVKDKDAVETALYGVANGELISDQRTLVLQIPASTAGSIIGYEKEQNERPYQLADAWDVQDIVPTRETSYTLRLPPGWSYRGVWLNHAPVAPTETAAGEVRWVLNDEPAVRIEPHMPPWRGIAGQLLISLIPPASREDSMQSWSDLGAWEARLVQGRRDPSPEIRAKVAELTSGIADPAGKMRALAAFVQSDIRYVAIELGIGGYQPHPAAEVFSHRYGDCKDKVTLLSAMLAQIGIDSYYVIINVERGSVTAATPPNLRFNHAILAIRIPEGVTDPALVARKAYPPLGSLLFFDPTDDLTPLGSLSGPLQGNFGLLVTDAGGELLQLPQLTAESNGILRTAKLTLDAGGNLSGEVRERRVGDDAATQREALHEIAKDTDQIKPIESLLAASLGNFEILKAAVGNLGATDKPLEWIYEFKADQYAKPSGDLWLVRPRVIGSRAQAFLETKEPRQYPIEFDGPGRYSDVFEISLPAGFAVDDLPEAVQADYGFAAYQSKTEVVGHLLRYSRTFEIKNLSVPADRAEDLKTLYRVIAADERNSVVLKRETAANLPGP